MRRFFIEKSFIEGDIASITGKELNHLKNVLRLKEGGKVVAFDGTGTEYHAEISEIRPDAVTLKLLYRYHSKIDSSVRITIGQAFLKDKKMDTLVRNLTELGMFRWIPFMAARSVPNPDRKRLKKRTERWQDIARESLKQCRLSVLPEIHDTVTFDELMSLSDDSDLKIFFYEGETTALKQRCQEIETPPEKIFVLLGPEGGFAPEEVEKAKAKGFITASLGPRIMKADTASIAALTLVQYLFGDLGKNIS